MGPWVPGTQGPWEGPGAQSGRGDPWATKPFGAHPKDPWDPGGHPGTLGGPRGPSGDPGAPWGNPGTLGPKTHTIWDLGPNGPNGTQGPRGTPGALYLRVNLILQRDPRAQWDPRRGLAKRFSRRGFREEVLAKRLSRRGFSRRGVSRRGFLAKTSCAPGPSWGGPNECPQKKSKRPPQKMSSRWAD